jgi:hypothetical protein
MRPILWTVYLKLHFVVMAFFTQKGKYTGTLRKHEQLIAAHSVADPGYIYQILDPGSKYFHHGSRVKKIPDPVSPSASKN